MSLLSQFEQQYSNLTAEITAKIGQLGKIAGHSDRRDAIRALDGQMEEVSDVLDQMELAIRELPKGPEKSKYENRLTSYRADRAQLEKELKKASSRFLNETGRDELMGRDEFETEEMQTQLIDNTERLERSSRKLQDGYRVAIETEQIGAEILSNLETQRSVLSRTRERLKEAEEDLSQSSRVLSRMIRRVLQNRLVLVVVIAFLLIIISATIYAIAK